jgi:Fic family protein
MLTGLTALVEQFQLQVPAPAVRSEVVQGARRTRIEGQRIYEQYPPSYAREDIPFEHLRFGLRYEPIDLGVVAAFFRAIPKADVEAWVRSEPTGKFARRAWYLYEFLTGTTLDILDVPPTRAIPILEPDLHITSSGVLVSRHRVIDNLLGNRDYCPLIRRTEALNEATLETLRKAVSSIVAQVDPVILARAVQYLYTKETRSSFAIERETPSKDRTDRFVAALTHASDFNASAKEQFIRLQNLIVDPRYAQHDWRTIQNFVGQTASDWSERVQFVCPKPEDVPSLMEGWMRMVQRLEAEGTHPISAAAAAAFGFVFIHPFEDGNGRIHRFLVHHTLGKMGFTPTGVLFPVSAAMLRDLVAYDRVLKNFSAAIMPLINHRFDDHRRLVVLNETAHLYRYFDATAHSEYLVACIRDTIEHDLKEEIGFIQVFDAALQATMQIVDMPDQRASLLLKLILQNGGKLSKAKRSQFSELTDAEVERIESAVQIATQEARRLPA